jgi:hypothetical protein
MKNHMTEVDLGKIVNITVKVASNRKRKRTWARHYARHFQNITSLNFYSYAMKQTNILRPRDVNTFFFLLLIMTESYVGRFQSKPIRKSSLGNCSQTIKCI